MLPGGSEDDCASIMSTRKVSRPGKLASLNSSWQSNKGMFCALGMAGIEPMQSQSRVTGHGLSPTTLRGLS